MGMRDKVEQQLLASYENYYRLAYSYVRNENDAMDIVQESAYKAMKGSSKVKEEEFISTWIYRIVINTSLDFLRRHKKETLSGYEQEPSYEDTYMDFDVIESINRLEDEDKAIIILRFFEDQKLESIAEITGINVNTVKTRLYRALRKLKIDLKEYEPRHKESVMI